ncbi:MAG: hypothetical protein ACHQEM_12240, partial [Chitinophagales bacterium]
VSPLPATHAAQPECSHLHYIRKKMISKKGLCSQLFSKPRNDWKFIHVYGFGWAPMRHLSFN